MNVCRVLEELGDVGFDDLAHGVAGKGVEEQQAGGKLVGGEGFGGPGAEGGKIEVAVWMQNNGGGDALAPFGIGDADDGALGDGGMGAEGLFDFESGEFVTAGLEDVDAGAAEDAIGVVLDDGGVAGAEPAVAEGFAGGFGFVPVFVEDGGTADFDLAG
jgi:hypothetical protein